METIRFEPNVPVVLELKYDEGREVEGQYGPQFMYTTSDDRRVYLNPPEAQEIARQGIRRGMKFRVTKQMKGKKVTGWLIERLDVQPIRRPEPPSEMEQQLRDSIATAQAAKAPAGPQPVSRPAAIRNLPAIASPVSPEVTQSDSTRPGITLATQLIAGNLIASIDAYLIAVDYAKSKGIHATLDIDFNAEDVRSSASTVLIKRLDFRDVADAISNLTLPEPRVNGGAVLNPPRVNGGIPWQQ